MVRSPACLDGVNKIENDRDFLDAHAGGRLVEQKHLRPERDQDRDFQLALVAVRQQPRARIAARGQAGLAQNVVGFRDQFGVLFPGMDQIEPGAATGFAPRAGRFRAR